MEQTTVLIIGAGPSGLALGALLGRMNLKVCISGCRYHQILKLDR